ncbi:MFS transporter [Alteraurantiacibacter aquimixticola]|uniref:MFS transporter n=1 Tax=Alteraurantiacibacter aquimixticola TaxID=2489173 RepID=A0A4V4U8N6_9SPHN|nr:MFS transporter [Alteraurantiacibacter aquimixticola]TIX50683.1 MFS transporter [Alteraurantiacibacter aquimixticola]
MPGPLPRVAMAQYCLAYLGVHLGFMPLLVLLVPRRIEGFAPASAAELLSWLLLLGAVVAAASNIYAGHMSDRWLARHGNRRGLIAVGVGALAASYVLLAITVTYWQTLAAILVFQVALNIAFAPLAALLSDHFRNEQKGRMGSAIFAALPASNLSVVFIAWLFPQDSASAFLFAGALAIACFLPLLMRWDMGALQQADVTERVPPAEKPRHASRDFAICWSARLAMQLGAAFVHGYIYLYLGALLVEVAANGGSLPDRTSTGLLSTITGPAAVIAIVITLACGVVSDRMGLRRLPLLAASLAVAAGLAALAQADGLAMLMAGYIAFSAGLSTFLSIEAALVAQLVSGNPNRGALLGIMNLTNTLPSMIAPGLTLVAYQQAALQQQLSALFMICAALALASGVALQFVRTVR